MMQLKDCRELKTIQESLQKVVPQTMPLNGAAWGTVRKEPRSQGHVCYSAVVA